MKSSPDTTVAAALVMSCQARQARSARATQAVRAAVAHAAALPFGADPLLQQLLSAATRAAIAGAAAVEPMTEAASHVHGWPAEKAVALELASSSALDAAEGAAEAVALALSALMLRPTGPHA